MLQKVLNKQSRTPYWCPTSSHLNSQFYNAIQAKRMYAPHLLFIPEHILSHPTHFSKPPFISATRLRIKPTFSSSGNSKFERDKKESSIVLNSTLVSDYDLENAAYASSTMECTLDPTACVCLCVYLQNNPEYLCYDTHTVALRIFMQGLCPPNKSHVNIS